MEVVIVTAFVQGMVIVAPITILTVVVEAQVVAQVVAQAVAEAVT